MYQSSTLAKSTSTTEISSIHSQVSRAPEERFPHTFKSLFTLADVAAKRRANGGIKKLTLKSDENKFGGGHMAGSAVLLKRSKSSGDVAILGETSRALNVAFEVNVSEKRTKPVKGLRSRSATISASPSKIPKGKSLTFLHTTDVFPASPEDEPTSILVSNTRVDLSEADALKVDDALFVMLTPPQTPAKKTAKNLTLAAHVPSLPKVASPFSPRINQPWSSCHLQPRGATRAAPGTGHTSASLHLTKSHWELRYETWVQGLRKPPRPRSARSIARPVSRTKDESPLRSRFPPPLTNPALFPRAGSLTPTALRPVLDRLVVEEDARPALELDWAMRAWPLDKIQRALFIHDMDVRVWFPVGASDREGASEEDIGSELELTRATSVLEDDEREQQRALRRWEWDWELRWRVIEGMVEEDNDRDRAECEYDVFLAEENSQQERAYGGCEMFDEDLAAAERMVEVVDWAWKDEAMEVDRSQ